MPSGTPWYKSAKNNWGPRLAFTWSPAKFKNKTVLRIGAGYYYGPGQGEDLIQPIESDRVSTTTTGRYPVDALTVVKNFNVATATGIGVRAYAPGYKVPERILSYTASLQQQVWGGAILQLAYVGSQGRNLFLRSVANQITQVVAVDKARGDVGIRGNRPAIGSLGVHHIQDKIRLPHNKGLANGIRGQE